MNCMERFTDDAMTIFYGWINCVFLSKMAWDFATCNFCKLGGTCSIFLSSAFANYFSSSSPIPPQPVAPCPHLDFALFGELLGVLNSYYFPLVTFPVALIVWSSFMNSFSISLKAYQGLENLPTSSWKFLLILYFFLLYSDSS